MTTEMHFEDTKGNVVICHDRKEKGRVGAVKTVGRMLFLHMVNQVRFP